MPAPQHSTQLHISRVLLEQKSGPVLVRHVLVWGDHAVDAVHGIRVGVPGTGPHFSPKQRGAIFLCVQLLVPPPAPAPPPVSLSSSMEGICRKPPPRSSSLSSPDTMNWNMLRLGMYRSYSFRLAILALSSVVSSTTYLLVRFDAIRSEMVSLPLPVSSKYSNLYMTIPHHTVTYHTIP